MSFERHTTAAPAIDKSAIDYPAKKSNLLKLAAKYNPSSSIYQLAAVESYHEEIYHSIPDDFLGGAYQKFQNLAMLHAYIDGTLRDQALSALARTSKVAMPKGKGTAQKHKHARGADQSSHAEPPSTHVTASKKR